MLRDTLPNYHFLLISANLGVEWLFDAGRAYWEQFHPTVISDFAILRFIPENFTIAVTVSERLATIASTKYEGVVPVLSVLNTYFKRSMLPIGVPHGEASTLRDTQHWSDSITAKYPHLFKSNDQATEAVAQKSIDLTRLRRGLGSTHDQYPPHGLQPCVIALGIETSERLVAGKIADPTCAFRRARARRGRCRAARACARRTRAP